MQADDLIKTREIHFSALPPGQGRQAWLLLAGLDALEVGQYGPETSIRVTYSLEQYSLQRLENALIELGFHLDNSLFHKIRRALIHYSEQVQIENHSAPEQLLKSHKVFVEI